ncbi:MAG: hypothetical protein AAGK14_06645 [Verrucomicrobiota bacterium]
MDLSEHETLPPHVMRRLESAVGYLELDLPEEAWVELEGIDHDYHAHPIIMLGRVDVRMRQARWEDAVGLAEALCRVATSEPGAYISRSFCLHCLGRTLEAREKLLEAPHELEKVPTFHYNLACYECTLGNLDAARRRLAKAISLYDGFEEFAGSDPDLKALHPELPALAHTAKKAKRPKAKG